ncbi:MAG: transposase [Planctomycetes bacterium]|nr:transposase [Planctomycetota bacterium]
MSPGASNPRTTGQRRHQPAAQLLPFRPQHGGRRAGAGRKPNGPEAGVDHRTRAALAARFPVHVTVKLRSGLPRLRRREEYAALRAAFAAGCRGVGATGAFRLCHYAVLNDHLHLIVEAHERLALSRGIQGLLVRIAKKLNTLWQRKGKVFADRYHDHILKSPRETRNALRYVLQNARHHAAKGRMVDASAPIDLFTSAPWFDGFREPIRVRGLEAIVRPITDSRTWLLTLGWRRHGLLDHGAASA